MGELSNPSDTPLPTPLQFFIPNIAHWTENLELKSCQLFQILKNDTFCAANDNGIQSV